MDIDKLNTQLENPLEIDDVRIKSLELSSLRKILPLYKNNYKEGTKRLDALQNETTKHKQKLNGLEVQKFELETSIAQFQKIDMELGARESNAIQELKKAKVMCPIYQYKMNNFLESFHSEDNLKEYSPPVQWIQRLNKLLEQKQKLQKTINANEKTIEEFVKKYL